MKLHITLLSAAIASTMFASPLWADDDREAGTPSTTSARPMEGMGSSRPDNSSETRPTTAASMTSSARPMEGMGDSRPPAQKIRESEKDKDDAKVVPKTKPGAAPTVVQADKTIHYPGDSITLKTVVPKSLTDVWSGKAVVKIVITMPGGDLAPVVLDVPTPTTDQNTQGDKPRQLAALPADVASTLPAGDYQMAMIVTKIGGDPLKVGDWYAGFRSLLGVKRLKIAATTTPDTEDPNKTGNVTGDTDGDGYPDSDPTTGGTTTPPTGGTTTGGTMTPPTGGTTTGGTTTPPADGTTTGGTTTPPAGGTTTNAVAGKTAFDASCASCHGTPSRIMAAADPAKTRAAIDANKGGMGSLKSLTSQQLGDIAAYVATGG